MLSIVYDRDSVTAYHECLDGELKPGCRRFKATPSFRPPGHPRWLADIWWKPFSGGRHLRLVEHRKFRGCSAAASPDSVAPKVPSEKSKQRELAKCRPCIAIRAFSGELCAQKKPCKRGFAIKSPDFSASETRVRRAVNSNSVETFLSERSHSNPERTSGQTAEPPQNPGTAKVPSEKSKQRESRQIVRPPLQ